MHSTTVTLKTGATICGTIWEWRPLEGWFSIVEDDARFSERIELSTVASAVTRWTRDTASTAGQDRDELARARKDGWPG